MPMIGGRFYMNPAMGAAIENARARGDAMKLGAGVQNGNSPGANDDASGWGGQGNGAQGSGEDGSDSSSRSGQPGAIQRVDIEVAETPGNARFASGSGGARSSRGYVAHVHRQIFEAAPAGASNIRTAFGVPSATPGIASRGAYAPAPETHVFTTAGDLVNFLRDTLADDPGPRG